MCASPRYNELLAAETALRSQFIEVRSAPRAKIELEAQVEMLNVEVDKAHRERAAAVSELATLREELATRAAAGQDDASLQAQLDNVTAQCAKFRSESTTVRRGVACRGQLALRVRALTRRVLHV